MNRRKKIKPKKAKAKQKKTKLFFPVFRFLFSNRYVNRSILTGSGLSRFLLSLRARPCSFSTQEHTQAKNFSRRGLIVIRGSIYWLWSARLMADKLAGLMAGEPAKRSVGRALGLSATLIADKFGFVPPHWWRTRLGLFSQIAQFDLFS